MVSQREPMLCPRCKTPMNRHAEKPSDPLTAEEATRAAKGMGLMIEEVHLCPECGEIGSRRLAVG